RRRLGPGVTVDPAAAQGFSAGADAYERGRPSYPPAAVDHVVRTLGLGPGRRVVDLGAGTGKFAELLVGAGADVVAVEPVAEMRRITRWTAEAPYRRDADWAAVVAGPARGRLSRLVLTSFPYDQLVDRETLLDRVRSISYLAAGPPDELDAVLADVLDLVWDF